MSIEKDDVPFELHELVEIVGIENFEKVSKYYGGTSIYIPVHRKLSIGTRNREIIRAYNGRNMSELSRKYGLTKKQIKKIIEKG